MHVQDAHGGGIFQSIADGVKGVANRFTAPVSGDEANAKAQNAADTVSAKVCSAVDVTIVAFDLPFCSRWRALHSLALLLLQQFSLTAAALARVRLIKNYILRGPC